MKADSDWLTRRLGWGEAGRRVEGMKVRFDLEEWGVRAWTVEGRLV
mgnify:CR=1 FL=1